MGWTEWYSWAALGGVFLLALGLRLFARCEAPFHSTWTGMLSGLAALGAVNLCGLFTHIPVPINGFTAGWAAVSGIPGVIGLLFAQILVQLHGI